MSRKLRLAPVLIVPSIIRITVNNPKYGTRGQATEALPDIRDGNFVPAVASEDIATMNAPRVPAFVTSLPTLLFG